MQARVDLVREMNSRQGFLDGEDQKTLISFVLLAIRWQPMMDFAHSAKRMYRFKDHPTVKIVSDQPASLAHPAQLSGESLKQVKQLVAEYLPGADFANLHLSHQEVQPNGKPAQPVKNRAKMQAAQAERGSRLVVTVSKQVLSAEHMHKHYVRVTLDEGGRPVKLSISR